MCYTMNHLQHGIKFKTLHKITYNTLMMFFFCLSKQHYTLAIFTMEWKTKKNLWFQICMNFYIYIYGYLLWHIFQIISVLMQNTCNGQVAF